MTSQYKHYIPFIDGFLSNGTYKTKELLDEDSVSISTDIMEIQYDDNIDDEDEDECVMYPPEQLIAKYLHIFFINNQEVANSIYDFIDIYNEFVGNPL
jgi:hypothetical protein